MFGTNFFRNIRNKLTGLNAIQKRFDVLHARLTEISSSIDDIFDSVSKLDNYVKSQLSIEVLDRLRLMINNESSEDETLRNSSPPLNSITPVLNSLIEICGENDKISKFAFLIHDPLMLVHYSDVWKELGPSSFTIVLTKYFSSDLNGNEKVGLSKFLEHVHSEGYVVRNISEIISCGIMFEYVVTNHVISGSIKNEKLETEDDRLKKLINRSLLVNGKNLVWEFDVDDDTYLPLQVGNKQIRYMYGADISDGWSLQVWNNIYDYFLCHGVNDEREIKKRFKGKAFVMGYPRYDRFFSEVIDLNRIKSEFKVSGTKKTILWMPTLGEEYSSIPLFAEPLSTIRKKYNIIVRPHPFSFVKEKEYISLLEGFNFNIDRNILRDMNELFSVADVVLADNGGTPFSAIFLGKNVVFLDVPENLGPESAATPHIVGSSVLELKKHLPVVKNQDIHQLENMLDSDEFYKENNKHIDALFKKYFDSPRGGGAKRVADILDSL